MEPRASSEDSEGAPQQPSEQNQTPSLATLMKVDEDGLTFSNKTAQWIAFERELESKRPDALFHDPLAGRLSGKYGKILSDVFAEHAPMTFPGLGKSGFVAYHSSRTKLISDRIAGWLDSLSCGGITRQVVNLGSGHDARAFWDPSLAGVTLYIEVDEPQVTNLREELLCSAGDSLPQLVCGRRLSISLDLGREVLLDTFTERCTGSFDALAPTCWVLEGLVMYLEAPAVRGLYEGIAELSAPGSLVIVNVVNNSKEHHTTSFANGILLPHGWEKADEVRFGEPGFAWRYPMGVEPNKSLGFAFFRRK